MRSKMLFNIVSVQIISMQSFSQESHEEGVILTEQGIPIELSFFFCKLRRIWAFRLFERKAEAYSTEKIWG
jgi:hypothetical protein